MSHPYDGAVTLIETRTGFEAETIAAALVARGIDARTADTATSAALSGVIVRPKVLVAAGVETLARQVLDEARAEMTDIDWDNFDVGPEQDVPSLHAARRGRRVLMTVCIILAPIGLAVLALGMDRRDVMIQTIGGMVMLIALVVATSLVMMTGRRLDPDD